MHLHVGVHVIDVIELGVHVKKDCGGGLEFCYCIVRLML